MSESDKPISLINDRWFATNCAVWGRAIWRLSAPPMFSPSDRGFHAPRDSTSSVQHPTTYPHQDELCPFATEKFGTKWLLDSLWPDGLNLVIGGMADLAPLPPMLAPTRRQIVCSFVLDGDLAAQHAFYADLAGKTNANAIEFHPSACPEMVSRAEPETVLITDLDLSRFTKGGPISVTISAEIASPGGSLRHRWIDLNTGHMYFEQVYPTIEFPGSWQWKEVQP